MGTDDKRFEATPARRSRAVREGNAARSSELNGAAAFGGALLAATAAVPLAEGFALRALHDAATKLPKGGGRAPLTGTMFAGDGFALSASASAVMVLVGAAFMPACAAAVAAAAAALAQGGGLHVTPPRLDLKRLDPLAGLKRMAGGEALTGVAKAAAALGAVLLALWPLARDAVANGAALSTPAAAAAFAGAAALRACGSALAVAAGFALADYALARRRWLHGLRMSLEETKRDAKENDGDPQSRARRKSAHRTIVRGAIGRVREASFVVVNPTHVAVAVRYAPPGVPVPKILVRALDDAALRVRALAREHGIPVVEDVALARLLYAHGESGRAIPPQTYVAVAQIVASLAREGVL